MLSRLPTWNGAGPSLQPRSACQRSLAYIGGASSVLARTVAKPSRGKRSAEPVKAAKESQFLNTSAPQYTVEPFTELDTSNEQLMQTLRNGVNQATLVGQVVDTLTVDVEGSMKHAVLVSAGKATRVYLMFSPSDEDRVGSQLCKDDPVLVTGSVAWRKLSFPGLADPWHVVLLANTVSKLVDTQEQLRARLESHEVEFLDNRNSKTHPHAADYIHKFTGQNVWISGDPPPAEDAPTAPGIGQVTLADVDDTTVRGRVLINGTIMNLRQFRTNSGRAYSTARLIPQGLNSILKLRFWREVNDRLVAYPELVRNGTEVFVEGYLNTWETAEGQIKIEVVVRDMEVYGQTKDGELDAEQKWEMLLEEPIKFYDNRVGKPTPRTPDFKHKDRCQDIVLWLDDCPSHLRKKVDALSFS